MKVGRCMLDLYQSCTIVELFLDYEDKLREVKLEDLARIWDVLLPKRSNQSPSGPMAIMKTYGPREKKRSIFTKIGRCDLFGC